MLGTTEWGLRPHPRNWQGDVLGTWVVQGHLENRLAGLRGLAKWGSQRGQEPRRVLLLLLLWWWW